VDGCATYSLVVTLAAPSPVALDPGFGPGSDGMFAGMPAGFMVFFVLVVTAVVAVFAYTGYSFVRNARRMRQAGLDPVTAGSDLLVGLQRSRLLAGAAGLEDRLAEVDRLYQAGRISQAEHRQARAALLGGIAGS